MINTIAQINEYPANLFALSNWSGRFPWFSNFCSISEYVKISFNTISGQFLPLYFGGFQKPVFPIYSGGGLYSFPKCLDSEELKSIRSPVRLS